MLTRREAAMLTCLIDTVVAPVPPLPPVRDTDAVEAFDALLRRSPRINRRVVRVLLRVLDVGRFGPRTPAQREALLRRLEHTPARPAFEALRAFSAAAYYGDDGVARLVGYDASTRTA